MDDETVPDGFPVSFTMLVLQMSFTISLGGESIVAKLALIRLFSGVRPHVSG